MKRKYRQVVELIDLARISNRQLEVMDLAAAGLRTGEIAARLGISPRMARDHIRHVLTVTGMGTVDEAVDLLTSIGLM